MFEKAQRERLKKELIAQEKPKYGPPYCNSQHPVEDAVWCELKSNHSDPYQHENKLGSIWVSLPEPPENIVTDNI